MVTSRIPRCIRRFVLIASLVCASLVALSSSASAGTGTVSGQVYYDPLFGPNVPVAGAVVDVRTFAHAHVKFATTAADGTWSATVFANTVANGGSDYEAVVSDLYARVSPADGTRDVTLYENQNTTGTNFSVRGSTITGTVFHDLSNDGTKQANESGLGGASVAIDGPVDASPTTAPSGNYSSGSPVLPAGSYTITASKGSYTASTPARVVNPTAGANAAAAAFGLHFPTGPVSGDVHAETNGTPGRQGSEPPISGVTVTVSGLYDGQAFSLTTQTNGSGGFSLPVFAGSNRTVSAAQHPGYLDGPEFTAVPGAVTGSDQFSAVTVTADTGTGPFQFGETGASISGVTFSDRDADGQRDAGEPLAGGRAITATASGFAAAVTSDAGGAYVVRGLPAGDVTLTPDVAADAIAPAARILTPAAAAEIADEHFGYRFASLAGTVVNRQGGVPVSGVQVGLFGVESRSTTTAPDGTWSFFELAPGSYGAQATAPAGFELAASTPGTLGGSANAGGVAGIAAGIGQLGTGYELGLVPAAAGGGGGTAQAPDSDAPGFVGAIALANRTFRAGASGDSAQAARRRTPTGTMVTFRLDEAASVAFTVERAKPGRRAGRRCVKPTRRNLRRRKCTRWVAQPGGFTVEGAAGQTRFRFSGRLRDRKLKPGSYRLVAVATDAAGNHSPVARARFNIARR